MSDEPNIQPESETLPQQQMSEEERAAIERAWQEIEAKLTRSVRHYWADSWEYDKILRDMDKARNWCRD